jgi:hypothetical protein
MDWLTAGSNGKRAKIDITVLTVISDKKMFQNGAINPD